LVPVVDYVIIALFVFFFYRGWSKGLLGTLLGPISLVIGCIIAYVFYLQTQKFVIALLISIFAPFLINFFCSLLLKAMRKVKDEKNRLTFGQMFGATFNVLWCGSIVILTLVLIVSIPVNAAWLQKIQEQITNSQSYTFVYHLFGENISNSAVNMRKVYSVYEDPERIRELQESKEFKQLMNNTKIQEVLKDEELVQNIRDKNFTKVLSNSKMQSLFQDKELLKQFLELHKELLKQSRKSTDSSDDEPTTE